MNKTLTALASKLSWQLKDLNLELEALNAQLTHLQDELSETREQIHQACAIPAIINPEQEISRLNFIMRCQQRHETLSLEKKELTSRLSQQQDRQLRLRTELKMLEKYEENLKKEEQQKVLLLAQKENDEWVLQRGGNRENQ